MTSNKKTIALILAELKENYQGQFQITEHTTKVWMRRMEGIDADAVLASVEEFCNSPSKFPPSAGQIRTRAIELAHGEMTPSSGTDAWDRVVQWNSETPQFEYQRETPSSVALTDLEKRALNHIGGSWQLANSRSIEFERAAFIKYYDAQVAKQTVHRSATPAAKQLVASRLPALADEISGALPAHETFRMKGGSTIAINRLGNGDKMRGVDDVPTEAELSDIVGQLAGKLGGVDEK